MRLNFFLVLVILIIINFSPLLVLKTTKSEEKKYKELIIKSVSINDAKFVSDAADGFFPDKFFLGREDKKSWIASLASFSNVYKKEFKEVKLFINGFSLDAVFFFNSGKVFYFHNGRLLPEDKLSDAGLYSSYFFRYKKGVYEIDNIKKDFPKPMCIDFYKEIYGETPDEIFNNLGRTYVFGHRVSFNSKNGAIEKLDQAVKKISAMSAGDPDLKKWIKNIRSVETYIYRNIANDERISLHSFGIAIDIKTFTDKESYWYWSEAFREDWWNIPKEERVYIPQKVIDAFEEAGFAWGGKWFYFDNMHFEYRPEVVLYSSVSSLSGYSGYNSLNMNKLTNSKLTNPILLSINEKVSVK
jgi:D-alanyl-D-alanine carboxypeptidase